MGNQSNKSVPQKLNTLRKNNNQDEQNNNRLVERKVEKKESHVDGQSQEAQEDDQFIDQLGLGNILEKVPSHKRLVFPNNCIGLLTTSAQSAAQILIATGFLISQNCLLTAAHNILDDNNQIRQNLEFYLNEEGKLLNPIGIVETRFPGQYLALTLQQKQLLVSVKYDYALCKLESPVVRHRYITLTQNFHNDLEKINISGFKQIYKESNSYKADLFSSVGLQESSILEINPKSMMIKHLLSTQPGQSGSPLLVNQSSAVGIHKCAILRKQKAYAGCSVLFYAEMLENIKKWYTQMTGQKYKENVQNYIVSRSKIHKHCYGNNKVQIKPINSFNSYTFPLSCIARVTAQQPADKYAVCSNGFLISDNLIVAAASGIVNWHTRRGTDNLKVSLGTGNYKISLNVYTVECYALSTWAIENIHFGGNINKAKFLQDLKQDFCLLKTKQKIMLPQYLSLLVNYHHTKADSIQLYGFPQYSTYINGNSSQHALASISIDKRLIEHNFQTEDGMMGSPLIVQQSYVIGFHKLKAQRANQKVKGARLITIDLVQQLYEWNKTLGGSEFKVSYYNSKGQIEEAKDAQTLKQLYVKDRKKNN